MNIRVIETRDWNRDRLTSLLEKFPGNKVGVVGDVGVDRYTRGVVERISPEAPVPIVLVEDEELKLGLAANVAENLQVLGAVTYLTGVIGHDRNSADFRALLTESEISAEWLVEDSSRRTVLKDRIVSERQQLLRVDHETLRPISSETEKSTLTQIRKYLSQLQALILEDYAKGLFNESFSQTLIREARASQILTLVDPNLHTPLSAYRGADLMTPNRKEAEHLSGIKINDEASLLQSGRRLLETSECAHVVITLGKDGMALFSKGVTEVKQIPTYAREVYDVSGAGDTVIAVLALALGAGATLEEACILSNLAASVEVRKRGTATVSRKEILEEMEFFFSEMPAIRN